MNKLKLDFIAYGLHQNYIERKIYRALIISRNKKLYKKRNKKKKRKSEIKVYALWINIQNYPMSRNYLKNPTEARKIKLEQRNISFW